METEMFTAEKEKAAVIMSMQRVQEQELEAKLADKRRREDEE